MTEHAEAILAAAALQGREVDQGTVGAFVLIGLALLARMRAR